MYNKLEIHQLKTMRHFSRTWILSEWVSFPQKHVLLWNKYNTVMMCILLSSLLSTSINWDSFILQRYEVLDSHWQFSLSFSRVRQRRVLMRHALCNAIVMDIHQAVICHTRPVRSLKKIICKNIKKKKISTFNFYLISKVSNNESISIWRTQTIRLENRKYLQILSGVEKFVCVASALPFRTWFSRFSAKLFQYHFGVLFFLEVISGERKTSEEVLRFRASSVPVKYVHITREISLPFRHPLPIFIMLIYRFPIYNISPEESFKCLAHITN